VEEFGFSFVFALRPNFLNCPDYILTDSVVEPACGTADGSATLQIAGGPGPFDYKWSNGDTTPTSVGLAAGIYWVTFTDVKGCLDSLAITVNNAGGPVVDSLLVTHLLCPGAQTGAASVFVSGGAPGYSYQWNSSDTSAAISGLAAGSYVVTVTDAANCIALGSATITEPPQLYINLTSTQETCAGCNDGAAVSNPSGGSPPYSYQWSNGDSASFITNLMPGLYSLTVTDDNGCTSQGDVFINLAVANAALSEPEFLVFPNPTEGAFTISAQFEAETPVHLRMYDTQGRRVWETTREPTKAFRQDFHTGFLPAGIYLVEMMTPTFKRVRKIVVR
ncbi:MAG: T9SS type A sorting domain-containing protein, partial [Bacteroidota bacterium]